MEAEEVPQSKSQARASLGDISCFDDLFDPILKHPKPVVALAVDPTQTGIFGSACRYYGCVNNPDYLRIAFDFASTLLDIGFGPPHALMPHGDPRTLLLAGRMVSSTMTQAPTGRRRNGMAETRS